MGGSGLELRAFDQICPFVRMMRIKHDLSIAGKWQDIDHVFTLITSGAADFIVDGARYRLGRGDVILIPPFHTHVIVSESGCALTQNIMHFDFFEDPARCGLAHRDVLDQDQPKVAPERERILGEQPFMTTLPETEIGHFERLYSRTYGEFRDLCAGAGSPALLRAYCTELLVETLRSGQRVQTPPADPGAARSKSWIHVENALEYINAHFADEDLSNDRISAAIGVSPNYLTKRFCTYFGMPLHRYVVRLRIERARQLLLTGKCNVTEAAAAAGFSSIHVFSKTFKTVLGLTPSAYLEDVAGEKAVLRVYQEQSLIDRRRRAMLPERPQKQVSQEEKDHGESQDRV